MNAPAITPALRQTFGGLVPDTVSEEFLSWLAVRDEQVTAIAGVSIATMKDPGWLDLWEQDASLDECIEDLAGVDFHFEGYLLAHHGETP